MKACPTCGQRFVGSEEFCPKDGVTLVELDTDDEEPIVGMTIDGRYTVEKKIGEGGMGTVYLATHAVIGKKCALKVLGGQHQGESEVAERFIQEARSAAAIGNEHIIDITDFGQLPDGTAYFVMEFLDGKSLQEAVEEANQIPVERTLRILKQCCEALSAAHSADIIHRDLKPDNIFLIDKSGDPDFVKVLDFGIAKVARETGRLTRTGMIFGTPQYMSPEQAAGTEMDVRTDIYSLGIIMYEMLSGRVPFEADTFMGVLTKHLYEEPIPPRRMVPPVDIPQSVEAILLKAIQKKPNKRYQSMNDFGDDLQCVIDGNTPNIVYQQIRDTSLSTLPPPPPSEVLGIKKKSPAALDDGYSQKSRLPLVALVAAAVIIAGVIGFLLLGGDEGGKPDTPMTAAPTNDSKPLTTNETKHATTLAATPKEPEPPVKIEQVTVSSTPPGANLYKNGALVGRLPIAVNKPASADNETQYKVTLTGYEDEKLIITVGTPEKFEVALRKAANDRLGEEESKEKSKSAARRKRRKAREEARLKAEQAQQSEQPAQPPKKRAAATDLADPWAQ